MKEHYKGIASLFEGSNFEIFVYDQENNSFETEDYNSLEMSVADWRINNISDRMDSIMKEAGDVVFDLTNNDPDNNEEDFDSNPGALDVKVEKIMFVISTEKIFNENNVVHISSHLKSNGITIVPIGWDPELGNRCCSLNSYYTLDQIDKLKLDLRGLIGDYRNSEIEARLKFSFDKVTSVGESAYVWVEIQNISKNILDNLEITFFENSYFSKQTLFIDSIPPQDSIKKEIEFQVNRGANYLKLVNSREMKFAITKDSSSTQVKCDCNRFYFLAQMFMKDFLRFVSKFSSKGNSEIRTLVAGPVGCGKSSKTNFDFQLLSMDEELAPALSGKTSKTTFTKMVTDYVIEKFLDIELKTKIRIRDTWGKEIKVENESIRFDSKTLTNLIYGYYSDGYMPIANSRIEDDLPQKPENLIDVVIFVIKYSLIATETMDAVRRYCKELEEKNRQYIILLTFADELTKDNYKEILDPENENGKNIIHRLTTGENALDSRRIFFSSSKTNWAINKEDNIFAQSIAMYRVYRYIFTNYDDYMERLMKDDIYFRENRYIERNEENVQKDDLRKNICFEFDGNKTIINILGKEDVQIENELLERFDLPQCQLLYCDTETSEIVQIHDIDNYPTFGTRSNPIKVIMI